VVVEGLQGITDAVLQPGEVVVDMLGVWGGHGRSLSWGLVAGKVVIIHEVSDMNGAQHADLL
jgi:hypothetical protein